MKFKTSWERDLHIAVNPKSVIVEGDGIYVTERFNKLSKIDIHTGHTIWTQTVPSVLGWTTISNGCVFYMSQGRGLFTYCAKSGEQISKQEFSFGYLGYVEVCENIIITGGWRGYTDIEAYDLKTRKSLWSHSIKSVEVKQISIPYFLDNKRLLIVNHSLNRIQIMNAITGEIIGKVLLPDGVVSVDLGRPYSIINNQLAFITNGGKLFLLDDKKLSFTVENLPFDTTFPNRPYFFSDKIILQTNERTYCLFDRVENRVLWQIPIDHNSWTGILAARISNDLFVIAGSRGTMKVVNQTGSVIQPMKSEKRVTTALHNIDGHLIYGTKGSIKCVSYQT